MLHIRDLVLVGPFLAGFSSHRMKVGAFWEEHQPHRGDGVVEFLQMGGQPIFVLFPVSFEKDELRELHTPADDWDPAQRLFENNIDAAMHSIGISDPPKIEPVRVDLDWSQYDSVGQDQRGPLDGWQSGSAFLGSWTEGCRRQSLAARL